MKSSPDVPELVVAARSGDVRAVGRLISLIENDSPQLREVMAALIPHTGRAHAVGITGPPGVGKSTTTGALVGELRRRGRRVGVLAVDPSSPFSGGALLGDRIRMQDHALDADVFIRSMASRGQLGGLSWSTPQALRVLDAAGYDVILIETVGVGQSEVEIAATADTTVILLAPGMGDGIQAAKAGILEIGDVYVINKADRPGAEKVRRDLESVLGISERREDRCQQPVLTTSATRGEGIAEVVDALEGHLSYLRTSGALTRRRRDRAVHEMEAIALTKLRRQWGSSEARANLDDLADQIVTGQLDPYRAADALLG